MCDEMFGALELGPCQLRLLKLRRVSAKDLFNDPLMPTLRRIRSNTPGKDRSGFWNGQMNGLQTGASVGLRYRANATSAACSPPIRVRERIGENQELDFSLLAIGSPEGMAGENLLAARAIGRPTINMCMVTGQNAKGGGHALVCSAERGSTTTFMP